MDCAIDEGLKFRQSAHRIRRCHRTLDGRMKVLIQCGEKCLRWLSFGKLLLDTIEICLYTLAPADNHSGLTHFAEPLINPVYCLQGVWISDTHHIRSNSHVVTVFLVQSV